MATGMTTTTQLPLEVTQIFNKRLLVRAVQKPTFHRYADIAPFAKRQGTDTMRFRRLEALDVDTNPSTEGITGEPLQLSRTDVNATLQRYVRHVVLTDKQLEEGIIPIVKESNTLLADNMGTTLNRIFRDVVVAGTTARRAGGVATRAEINAVPVINDIRSILTTLETNMAQPISEVIKASDKIGTEAVDEAFFAIHHPHLKYDIAALSGFTWTKDYGSTPKGGFQPGEYGAIDKIRFCTDTDSTIWTGQGAAVGATFRRTNGNADVYPIVVFGKYFGSVVPLQGDGKDIASTSVRMIYHPLGWGDDPGEQRATVAAKCASVLVITNENFIGRVEAAATAL